MLCCACAVVWNSRTHPRPLIPSVAPTDPCNRYITDSVSRSGEKDGTICGYKCKKRKYKTKCTPMYVVVW